MRGQRNWQVILQSVLVLIGGLFLQACTISKQDKYPDTVQVKLPWYSEGRYQIQVINLFTVHNMTELQGLAAKFYLSPSIQNGKLVGITPRIKTLKTKSGVYVPTDVFSTELLSLYAHFEKLQDMDLQFGIDQIISDWPRQQQVAVRAEVIGENKKKTIDNALYSSEIDSFLFVPYTLDHLPLSVNAGVIAHEYFHSLFHKLVLLPAGERIANNGKVGSHDTKELKKLVGLINTKSTGGEVLTDEELYHALLFRAINEAFADVWGWLYSGDFQFVKRSAPEFEWRDLNQNDKQFFTKEHVKNNAYIFLKDDKIAYDIGQMYTRRIYSATQKAIASKVVENEAAAKKLVGAAVLKMLSHLQTEFVQTSSEELLDPARPLELLQAELPSFEIVRVEK